MLSLLPKELLLELLEYIEPHHRPLLRTADARLAGILPTPDYDLLLREACHDGHLSMVQECVQNGSKPTDLDLTSLIKRNHHEAWWWVVRSDVVGGMRRAHILVSVGLWYWMDDAILDALERRGMAHYSRIHVEIAQTMRAEPLLRHAQRHLADREPT